MGDLQVKDVKDNEQVVKEIKDKKPQEKEKKENFDKIIKDIQKILEHPNRQSQRLKLLKIGNTYKLYQGTPTSVWASFVPFKAAIYNGTIREMLKSEGLFKKYPKYFVDYIK